MTWWCEYALLPGGIGRSVAIHTMDGRFSSIQADTRPAPGQTQLAGVTIPGLANTHSHAFHRALRARTQAGTGTFWTWRELMYDAAMKLNPDRYHRLARAVFAEMTMAGQTVVGEFHYVHHQPDGRPYDDPNAMGNALLAAADEAGIRITLLDTFYGHGGLGPDGYEPVCGAQRRYRDGDVDQWACRVSALSQSSGQRVGAAIHSVRAVDSSAIAAVAEWCRKAARPLHAHVSEQPDENDVCQAYHGCTPTELLHQNGALGPRFCAVHATHVTEQDVALLGSTGSSVCVCPTTERDLGDGIGPTSELRDAGVDLHLGSDSHAVIDHFIEARSIELHERLRTRRRGIHSANDLLAMATVHGHRSLGWNDAGAIAVGNRADLVTVRMDSERTAGTPPEFAVAGVVFAATASDVTSVIIDGTAVVSDGHHTSIDVSTELAASIEELVP